MSFYESIANYYDRIFPHDPAKTEFSLSFVGKEKARILDVGCATGSFCIDLADRGHQITGVDLDAKLIDVARGKAGVKDLDFRVMNMLELNQVFRPESFDLIACVGNTLVHLQTPIEMEKFFASASRLLAPGSVLILQFVNYDRILSRQLTELPVIENEDIKFTRRYKHNEDAPLIDFHTRLEVKQTGRSIVNEVQLYPLQSGELEILLRKTGFPDRHFFGNFKKDPFSADSPALVAAALKG